MRSGFGKGLAPLWHRAYNSRTKNFSKDYSMTTFDDLVQRLTTANDKLRHLLESL
jgi:hypothetical protein